MSVYYDVKMKDLPIEEEVYTNFFENLLNIMVLINYISNN